nr:hypothetical protein [Tanacetum cinerariifolium]
VLRRFEKLVQLWNGFSKIRVSLVKAWILDLEFGLDLAPPSPDYIPGLEYPEYLSPTDDVFPAEEQPLPAAVSPTAELPRYIADSEPEMHPEEEDR